MSLVLIGREIDAWKPAEHTGTFRGNNLAFVASTAALGYWKTDAFAAEVRRKGQLLEARLNEIRQQHSKHTLKIRGRGLIYGLEMPRPELAKAVSKEAFRRRVIIELAGPNDEVLKFLPPLVIEEETLQKGINTIADIIQTVLA